MNRHRIVTLQSLPDLGGGLESRLASTPEQRLLTARYAEIVRDLQTEATKAGSDNVMVAVSSRDGSRLQSELARQATVVREGLPSNALEAKFGVGLNGGDWWGWLKSTLDWVDREDIHPQVRPSNATAFNLGKGTQTGFRVAVFGDWGTGLYGAPKIADAIRRIGPFDLVLHLGDVYYSGTVDEVQERLIDVWPTDAGRISRTLNGNHEMYSGGYGYFDVALKALRQESSYFACQTAEWLLVGLDTAYVEHDIDTVQLGWLNAVISAAGHRKIVLFSHHQLFSRLDGQGKKLFNTIKSLLAAKIIKAWYWGHEHQCIMYDRHAEYGFLGRCLGNGGIPEARKAAVLEASAEVMVGNMVWRRLRSTADAPSCLVLDGPNRFVDREEEKFAPHGFMTLEFEDDQLLERVYLADGTRVRENPIE